ncbi:MAG: hypothetical protein CL943_01395 [Candidatus Diapherotrites archaeon]|uniref:Lon proteolytic domain-containing protein n=1 Tax=Candidatus Iainarchaeum sp. TaxID=3101447 RepID=A0A2D6M0J4_9ARCH|nr:hypothetical protein [Candidatus Diapherotrites archaeon]|tara:strand:- start:762 stop:1505 length:744 start_codon:yes stop_codon:yes gene_type:complete
MNGKELLIVLAFGIATFALGYLLALPTEPELIRLEPLPEKEFTAMIDVVAVKVQREVGIVNVASVEVKPGKGRVLFALNPFVEPDTQQSAEIAASVAENITQKSLAEKDVIYSIEAGEVQLVGGPSAGAALTIATIAAIEEKDLNESVGLTGSILSDGSIGQVGGIIEKAAAVEQSGKTIFLVPPGQTSFTYYEKQIREETRGPFVFQRVNYVPKTLELNEFAREQEWNLNIIEVNSIEEALLYFLS